jgi:oligosaccharyltransferase complex subunit alpha (ribophorin I)
MPPKRFAQTVLTFEARYPLMGGWKVDFTLGYSVPLKGFLFRKATDGKRRLTMDLCTSLEDVYVEDMVVRVVLPEGAHSITPVLPFELEQSFDIK